VSVLSKLSPGLRQLLLAGLGAVLLSLGVTPAAQADFLSSPSTAGVLGTPLRAFAPVLPVTDGVDVAALRTGEPVVRPLEQQLQLLFEAFLAASPTGATEVVQLQVSYSYEIDPGSDLRLHIPVLLLPWAPFSVPDDWSPGTAYQSPADAALVCKLAADIEAWFAKSSPGLAGAELTFDLAAWPKDTSGQTAPELQAQDLRLSVADITNL
jgi:hypothetical protein